MTGVITSITQRTTAAAAYVQLLFVEINANDNFETVKYNNNDDIIR